MHAQWNQNSQTEHARAFVFLATSLLHPPQGYFLLFTIVLDVVGKLGERSGDREKRKSDKGRKWDFGGITIDCLISLVHDCLLFLFCHEPLLGRVEFTLVASVYVSH